MLKKILAIGLLLTAVIILAETFAKDVPFVQKSNAFVSRQFDRVYQGPVERQWTKVVDYFKRLDLKANRKKANDDALKTTAAVAPVKKAPPQPACQPCKTSPKTGITKSSSRQLWKDDKGVYNWKDNEKVYE